MTGAVTRQHPIVKRFRELARSPGGAGLDRELLLDGVHLLAEAHASGVAIEDAAFDHAALDTPQTAALAKQLERAGTRVHFVPRTVMDAMSPVKTPSGAVGIARRTLATLDRAVAAANALVLIAADVQDPGNVGALIRTAEAAGATAVIACGATADPFGWKALRGSMGSALRLPIARASASDTLDACRRARVKIAALAATASQPLFGADLRSPLAIIVGGEGSGLPSAILDAADMRLTIPMHPPVESLNVGVAAALVLYEAFRQRS